MEDIQQTWKKIEYIAKKTGMKEGISDGREKNYQKSFDIGYEEGFQNGFLIGKAKGMLLADAHQNSSEMNVHPLLENIGRGSCEICKQSIPLAEKDVQNLIEMQRKSYSSNEKTLTLHFNKVVSNT
ncbi:hypothetical protein JTB14_010204 [Gonioctena quinquepunctata]|nr:hypothetical protein JTB14_010204 [Gonioctena quinquepunctata]